MTSAAMLEEYRNWHGKIEVVNRVPIDSAATLAKVYTPGVAAPCKEIARDRSLSFDYTRRGNLVAVVTDGSAVLGLGDIGPEAGMPVMEGKAALLKSQADVDGFPMCIKTEDTDEIVRTIELLSGTFGAIHLEDIAAPVALRSRSASARRSISPSTTTTSTGRRLPPLRPSWARAA